MNDTYEGLILAPQYVKDQLRRQKWQRDHEAHLKRKEEAYQAKLKDPGKIGFLIDYPRDKKGCFRNPHRKLTRNDKCLCGSGKKIKNCPCPKTKGYE